MRDPSTYRSERRNACLRPKLFLQEVWSPKWYFQGSTKAKAHEAKVRYIPSKAKEQMKQYRRAFLKAQKYSMRGIVRA